MRRVTSHTWQGRRVPQEVWGMPHTQCPISCRHNTSNNYYCMHACTFMHRPTWLYCQKTRWQRDSLCTVSTQYLDGDREESSQTHLSMFSTPKTRHVALIHIHFTNPLLQTLDSGKSDLDSPVSRCWHNVSVVKVHYINCRSMSHQDPA